MKKIRRSFAILMVIVILLSTLILPAAAADASEIEPQSAGGTCLSCGGTLITTTTVKEGSEFSAAPCNASNTPMVHTHQRFTYTYTTYCSDCDYTSTSSTVKIYCHNLDKYI